MYLELNTLKYKIVSLKIASLKLPGGLSPLIWLKVFIYKI